MVKYKKMDVSYKNSSFYIVHANYYNDIFFDKEQDISNSLIERCFSLIHFCRWISCVLSADVSLNAIKIVIYIQLDKT